MQTYHDSRTIRTKLAIREAFLRLLQEKRLNKITISALTKEAQVNRVTFYLHYADINDFLDKLVDELIQELYDFLLPLYGKPYKRGYELEAMTNLVQYIADHHHVYRPMLVTNDVPTFTPKLMDFFRELMHNHSKDAQARAVPNLEIKSEIEIWYGLSALIGTISYWLAEDMPYSPEYLAAKIVELNPFQ